MEVNVASGIKSICFIYSLGVKEEKIYIAPVWKSHNSALFLFYFSREGAWASNERDDALKCTGKKRRVFSLGNLITWRSAEHPKANWPSQLLEKVTKPLFWREKHILIRYGPPFRELLLSWEKEVLFLSTEKL